MENLEKLKKGIELETSHYFRGKIVDIGELVVLLQKVFMARIDDRYKLSGVAVRIPNAMHDILDDNSSKKQRMASFVELCKFEPFLKKILFFLKPQKFEWVFNEKKGLGVIVGLLGLNPNKIDFQDENEQENRAFTDYDYHLYKVYNLRNTESHNMEAWSGLELEENISSIFIFYIEVLNRHKEALKEIISNQENDFSEYISSVINKFEADAKRFVSTETVEDYSAFESYAIEHRINTLEDDNTQERSGTVDFIINNSLKEKRMMLWGDAGMGKSTTLQYLTYIDAKKYSSGKSNVIPVYIPLGMLIHKDETLEQYICKIINVEYLTGIELFKNGKVALFLDGVNEIPEDNDIKMIRLKEIQDLIDKYPRMLIIISNRPGKYNNFKNVPVFRLQKMDFPKICDFLKKNSHDRNTYRIILDEIEKNHRLLQLIGTPLMTTRLIEIVRELKEMPLSEGRIIKKFLECLYKREYVEKKDRRFNELIINTLLIDLALYGFQKNGTNSGLSNLDVIACFANCLNRNHFDYNSAYALEVLLQLGVLSGDRDNEVIVFSHQAYQDYYLSLGGNKLESRQKDKEYTPVKNDYSFESSTKLNMNNNLGESSNNLTKHKDIKRNPKLLEDIEESIISHSIIDENAELDDYYRQYAKDETYEKSIMYRLHNINNRKERNKSIKLLAKYNLLLAAKAISKGETDAEIEHYVMYTALNRINETSNISVQTECILVFLELGRMEEIKKNIHKLDLSFISQGDKELNAERCVDFLFLLSQVEENPNLKAMIIIAIERYSKYDYEYSWGPKNNEVIKTIATRFSRVLKKDPYHLLKFYYSFNVPYKFFGPNIIKLIDALPIQHYNFIMQIINKYKISKYFNKNELQYRYLNWLKFRKNTSKNS